MCVPKTKEKEMIMRILEFNDIDANDVMTPRSEIFALPSSFTIEKAVLEINKSHYSRIPVYRKSIDDIIGIVYIPDLLREFSSGNKDLILEKIVRKPYFIPKQRKIDEIFKDFQRQHNHIAIVLDEHGLVTLEDLLEEIVGEIMDESDTDEFLIKRLDKNSILVDSRIEVKEINHFFNIEIPGDKHKIISEVFLEKFGRIPKLGDQLDFGGIKMVIEKATPKKIEKLRIIKY
jgi:putative hemolysin